MGADYLVFVYGTMLSGETSHGLLASGKPLGPARTAAAFELVDLGPYPGMIAGGRTAIVGELYSIDVATLATLDRHEGHPILFRRGAIALDDGREVHAYLLEPDQARGRRRIRSGDWRGRFAKPGSEDALAWRQWAKARAKTR